MEQGVVKSFNPKGDKRFGFLETNDGQELFFHHNDGRALVFRDGPVFLEEKSPEYPQVGDTLFFVRDEGREGQKASPWGFEFQLRKTKREVGLKLLVACPYLVERYPCLPALFAEAKRPGDSGPFTVSVKALTANIQDRSGIDHYPSGKRIYYYVLSRDDGKRWQYKHLPYDGFRTWRPDGVGCDYDSTSYIKTYIRELGDPWSPPIAILEIDTSRMNVSYSSIDRHPSIPRDKAEAGGTYNHTATLYVAQ